MSYDLSLVRRLDSENILFSGHFMNSLTIFRCTVVATVLSAATLLVSGCIAPLVIGGAAVTTTTVMTDRRTTGTIVSDEVVEKRITYDVSQALKTSPITSMSQLMKDEFFFPVKLPPLKIAERLKKSR